VPTTLRSFLTFDAHRSPSREVLHVSNGEFRSVDDQQVLSVAASGIAREAEAAGDDRLLIDHDHLVVRDLRLAVDEGGNSNVVHRVGALAFFTWADRVENYRYEHAAPTAAMMAA
jgi:hypothetical protein